MLRFKITRPPLPACLDRPRLLGALVASPVVVLAAPAGHGKTCLAAQVAAATGGPTAWFTADELDRDRAGVVAHILGALGEAWRDLGNVAPPLVDEDAAVSVLGAVLETVAGPGCLVLDDAHLLPSNVLDAIIGTAIAALPDGCRLVVCTRAAVPVAVVRAEATGRAVTVGAATLAFDEKECQRAGAAAGLDIDLHHRTGGWPLAIGMAMQSGGSSLERSPAGEGRHGALADVALSELPVSSHELLAVLARVPGFPSKLRYRLGNPFAAIERFGRDRPTLLARDIGWLSPREWLRDALSDIPVRGSTVDAVADALSDVGESELAAQLLLAEGRFERAIPLVERLAAHGLDQGRPAWVRSLLGALPPSTRTFTLDLQMAAAAERLSIVDPLTDGAASGRALLALVERAEREDAVSLLRARAVLASHYRMQADVRLFGVCEDALTDALTDAEPGRVIARRWAGDDRAVAAEMLRLYGHGLLFGHDRESVARGQRLIAAAIEVFDGIGRSTVSERAWSTYFEVLLFLRRPADAAPSVRVAAHRMAEIEHSDAAVRLAELATVEYLGGDHSSARRTIELARDLADRTGNRIALAPLDAIEVALDLWEGSFVPGHADRFDETVALLASHPPLAPFVALITAEFGIALVRHRQCELARRYLERAEQTLGASLFAHTTSFRCRRLHGLVLVAEGATADGRAVLEALRRDGVDQGRMALVDLVEQDLAERLAPVAVDPVPVVVHVLGPELAVSVNGEPAPSPSGYAAKLLALLVASDGVLTVDAAIEGLWPDADPDVGRNRLHGVLLRLRRSLGLRAGGPISCTEGLVRLTRSDAIEIDSWEFERAVADARLWPNARMEATGRYVGDVLSGQFAYDDTVAAYRRDLRRLFLQLATSVLGDPTPGVPAEELASLARRTWTTAPDNETVCRAAASALARLGRHAEARELVGETASALAGLGFDGDGFRRATLAAIGPPAALHVVNG